MSDDRQVPPPTESIHLPAPSLTPLGVAAGLALVAAGLFIGSLVSILGAVVGLVALKSWLRHNRNSIARLPR